jgi:type VI protein secretion system component VasK
LATSGFSTRVSLLRRVALIAVAAVAAICCVGFLVSYLGNRALLSQLKDAQAAEYSVPQANRPPEVSDLLRLEATGRLLNTLAGYNQEDSVPMSLSWGLYVGKDIYPQVCTAYARGLNQLILNPTRISMASSLKQLSYNSAVSTVSGNEAQQAYERAYNLLKTYLIATDQGIHAKGDKDFLSELNENWPARQLASKQQADLVAAQLSRYSAELVGESGSSCVVSPADENAVSNSRSYLNAFPPDQRMYQAMLADATAKIKQDINFDPQYADDAGDSYRVPAAFTKAGWTAMGHALQTPERYSSGEPWVLGESRQAIAEPQSYVPKLRERYKNEFIQHWLAFLTHARFSGYTGPADISPKIAKVAGARSALLMVLCVTSENTSVDKDIAGAFSGAAGLVSPTECEARVTGPKNAKYTDALFTLSGCLDKMSGDMTPEDKESRRKTCEDQSKTASETVEQLVANNEGTNLSVNKAVQVLLERPIKDPVIARELQPTPAPGAGDLCVALKHFSDDFPKSENSFAELQDIFKPGGLLDKHPVPPTNPNPRYTSFFNEAKRIQTALYPDGKTLQLHYTIAALPSPGVETFALAVGNQSRVQNINQFNSRKDFTWTGDPHDSFMLRLPGISPAVKEGSLAMFQFVTEVGEPGHLNESGYSFDVEVKQELGRQTTSDQKLKFLIDAGNASVLFQRVSLSKLGCTAKVGQ